MCSWSGTVLRLTTSTSYTFYTFEITSKDINFLLYHDAEHPVPCRTIVPSTTEKKK